MDFKRIFKALLFPHIAVILFMIPTATVFLVYSTIFFGSASLVSICSYVIAFYTLTAYTFTSFTVAIVNSIKYRKYDSPVYSASKIVSLISACVSILTLEATMLTTFSDGTIDLTERRVFLGTSGCVISAFIIVTAVYMIVNGTKRIKLFKEKIDGR